MSEPSQLYLCRTTAALFWRAVHEGRLPLPAETTIRTVRQSVHTYRELCGIDISALGLITTDHGAFAQFDQRAAEVLEGDTTCKRTLCLLKGVAIGPGIGHSLDVLVAHKKYGRSSAALKLHVMDKSLPPGSFMRVSDRVLVTSPALTYAHLCAAGRLLPAIELGMEWCGSYAIASANCSNPGKVEPLLTRKELCDSLEELRGLWGVGPARAASRWVVDGLASVREAEVYLALVLKPKMGGFGLPKPQVNASVNIAGTSAEGMTTDTYYVVDMLFGDNVVVEYDGRENHEVLLQDVTRDKERRSVLAALGYKVIVITRRDVSSVKSLRRKVSQIAQAVGIELPEFDAEEKRAHETLARWLFNPRHDHLPFGFGYV